MAVNIRKNNVQEITLRRFLVNSETLMFSQLIYPGYGLCEIDIYLPKSVKCLERLSGLMTVFKTFILSSSVRKEIIALYVLRSSFAT